MKIPFPWRNFVDSLVVGDYFLDQGKESVAQAVKNKPPNGFNVNLEYWRYRSVSQSRSGQSRSRTRSLGATSYSISRARHVGWNQSVTRSSSFLDLYFGEI